MPFDTRAFDDFVNEAIATIFFDILPANGKISFISGATCVANNAAYGMAFIIGGRILTTTMNIVDLSHIVIHLLML